MDINFLRYAGFYGALTLALLFVPQMVGMPNALGFATALPPLVASVIEGNAHAKAHGSRPTGRAAMIGAGRMTAAALGVNLLIFGLVNAAAQGQLLSAGNDPQRLALYAVVLVAVQFVFNRLGLRLAPQTA